MNDYLNDDAFVLLGVKVIHLLPDNNDTLFSIE